jgi:hypothetical protein
VTNTRFSCSVSLETGILVNGTGTSPSLLISLFISGPVPVPIPVLIPVFIPVLIPVFIPVPLAVPTPAPVRTARGTQIEKVIEIRKGKIVLIVNSSMIFLPLL